MINDTSFMCFGVKESDEIVSLVIRGQLLPQRSPRVHLWSFSAKFSVQRPFLVFFKVKTRFG